MKRQVTKQPATCHVSVRVPTGDRTHPSGSNGETLLKGLQLEVWAGLKEQAKFFMLNFYLPIFIFPKIL